MFDVRAQRLSRRRSPVLTAVAPAVLLALGLGAWILACGSPFGSDTGEGGSGGRGGGGAASTGGSANGGAGPTAGHHAGGHGGTGGGTATPCTWNAAGTPCGQGKYCNAPYCDSGYCEPLGVTVDEGLFPVCGCDQVTYWNRSLAENRGMSVFDDGRCDSGKVCGGPDNSRCEAGPRTLCAIEIDAAGDCEVPGLSGICWNLPDPCTNAGALVSLCYGGCTARCAAIESETAFFPDLLCNR